MKLRLTIAACVALSFSGCTNSMNSLIAPSQSTTTNIKKGYVNYDNAPNYKQDAFIKKQRAVGLSTKSDPKYKSFKPILTDDETRKWFTNNMYLLWDRQITRNQYITKSTSRFPAYKYEFTFIAHQF
jgi:hypothetical protein